MPYIVKLSDEAEKFLDSLPTVIVDEIMAELFRLEKNPEGLTRPSHYSELDRLLVIPPVYKLGNCYIIKAVVQLRGNFVNITEIGCEKFGFET